MYKEALSDLDEAIRLCPRMLAGYFNRAKMFEEQGSMNERLGYHRAVQTDVRCATAYNGRGLALDHLGQYELALNDLNRAMN